MSGEDLWRRWCLIAFNKYGDGWWGGGSKAMAVKLDFDGGGGSKW
jgi:hypothetical protein